ncbi:hypothetical protein E2C01_028493 [Portunus trituberculatus]|uniref:Uncharacterized protein n=1 Tax=Portunus trituberculatus TaxID=210409 RepID=A0A5B7EP66_PORTR|nr:hypothetical protein [Portunus trituberculatus]
MRLLLSIGDSRILGGLGEVTWLMRDGRWMKFPSDSVMFDSCGVTERLLDSTSTTSGLGFKQVLIVSCLHISTTQIFL